MLDTNICIFMIKHKPESVMKKFMELQPSDVCISSITYAELVHGVEKSKAKEKNGIALAVMLSEIDILPFDSLAAQMYGTIKADLERKGMPIGPMDTLIAAHAKAVDVTLVTKNTREFCRVDDLRLEDWVNI